MDKIESKIQNRAEKSGQSHPFLLQAFSNLVW